MEHAYTGVEMVAGIIGIGITVAFGAWAAVIKRMADEMGTRVEHAVDELRGLREELHKDRLMNERRFARLERYFMMPEESGSNGTN